MGIQQQPKARPDLEFLDGLTVILRNLEAIFTGECKPADKGPGYAGTSYAAGYTYTSACYEKDGLSVSIQQDPDEDVMYGELARPGWDVMRAAAMCEDEDTGAVVSRLFWCAWLKCLYESRGESR